MALPTSGPISHTMIMAEFSEPPGQWRLSQDGGLLLQGIGDPKGPGDMIKETDFYGLSSSVNEYVLWDRANMNASVFFEQPLTPAGFSPNGSSLGNSPSYFLEWQVDQTGFVIYAGYAAADPTRGQTSPFANLPAPRKSRGQFNQAPVGNSLGGGLSLMLGGWANTATNGPIGVPAQFQGTYHSDWQWGHNVNFTGGTPGGSMVAGVSSPTNLVGTDGVPGSTDFANRSVPSLQLSGLATNNTSAPALGTSYGRTWNDISPANVNSPASGTRARHEMVMLSPPARAANTQPHPNRSHRFFHPYARQQQDGVFGGSPRGRVSQVMEIPFNNMTGSGSAGITYEKVVLKLL